MKQINSRARLYAGAATIAVVTALSAPAAAQCVTDATTVTCAGTVTSGDVNAAMNAVAPPSVTLRVAADTTVTRTAPSVQPASTFNGAVDIGNAGTLGTTAATVGVTYFGTPDAATNTFSLTNSGLVTGGVTVGGVGGAITVTNTGTLAGGLQLSGSGPITLSSSGPIYVAGGNGSTTAVSLQSQRFVSTTTGTFGVDAVTTSTTTGGPVTATITGPVAIPAAGAGTPAIPQGVQIDSFGTGGSARLTLDAAAGQVLVRALGTDSVFTPGSNTTTVGGTTTTRSSNTQTQVGGPASATLGTNAQVASLSVQGGPGGASASIAGGVGTVAAPGFVSVTSSAANFANTSETVSDATGTTTRTTSVNTPVGGAASLDIAATGRVIGNANVASSASTATANVAGAVGTIDGTTVRTGSVTADARGQRSTSTGVSTSGGGAFSNANTNSQTASTGAASVGVAETGRVLGSISALASGGTASTTIAGLVGASDDSIVSANVVSDSRGSNTESTNSSSNAANGDFAGSSTFAQRNVGAAASTTIAATGRVAGSASALSNAGDATVVVAGTVGAGSGTTVTVQGNVQATARGINSTQANSNSNVAATGDFANSQNSTGAITGGAASATVASTGAVFGSVTVLGDRGAIVDNAGRIRDTVQANSSRTITLAQGNSSSQVTTAGAAGVSTVVNRNANTSLSQTSGGTASLVNRAGGVIEDGAFVSGVGGATLTNAGAIFGNVSVTSAGNRSDSANSSVTTATTTPAAAGGDTVRSETVSASSSSTTPIGGIATGTYGGTIGAAQGSLLAAATTINQTGQAGSTATFTGVAFADAFTSAGASRSENSQSSTSLTVTQPAVGPATPASETTGSSTSRSATTVVAANNSVSVTGALRNNGLGTGDLQATSTGGTVSVAIDGGTVEGGVSAFAGPSFNFTSGSDSSFRNTQAATVAGPVASTVEQSNNVTNFSEQRLVASTANVALTGNARVGGNVQVTGTGSGAGSTGASASVASTASIGGALNVTGANSVNTRFDNSSVATRTGATETTRTDRSSTVQTRSPNAGNATATIAGDVGGTVSVSAPYANASATLSGRILNGSGISVISSGTLSSTSSETISRGTNATTLATPLLQSSRNQATNTAAGGTATLAIASTGMTASSGASAVDGSIVVEGDAGATLSIAAGTRVLASNNGDIDVGSNGNSSTSSQTASYNLAGALTGQTFTFTNTEVGGPASFTNAGIIGSSTGYFGAPIGIDVDSIGGVTIANTGTIYGSIDADALTSNDSQTTTITGLTDPVTQTSTTMGTTTIVGGTATVTNSGVVSGDVGIAAATGTVSNTGVLRNGVSLGSAQFAGTQTTTQTATSSNVTVTAPATRFVQTYTLNQNGLLLNGVSVSGATVGDFSTNAPANATLRTSDVRATINLGNGSVTTGNIDAQIDMARARLTDTTVNLTGSGSLGAGTGLTPPASLGFGAAALRYENTPNFAAFAATDPALGNSASGTFVPSVGIASGSRITGVNVVERNGPGVFTIVGAPYLSVSNANPLAVYTMDVGTLRITSGELQLGVAGTDPANSAAVFGIRGNVVNSGGTLLLGRRVTDGTTSVVQGTNVRVDGNFTQAAGGTLSLAATPALVRIAGTQVGAQPADGILGFGGYGVALTPFVPFDPLATNQLRSTPSTLTVNGDLTLAGTVSIAAQPGAIYAAGRNADLITVSGTFNAAGLTVSTPMNSPFVRFALTPRTVGGQTVVSVDVTRTSYASVTTTGNASAAAVALDAAVPSVIAQLRAVPNPNAVTDVESYANVQDLATIISALDTQLNAATATIAFDQLGSGSIYGSLSAVTATAPFGDPLDAAVIADAGLGLWMRPVGLFSRFDGDSGTGAGRLKADNYGGSAGISITTGNEGAFGIGGGYGRINARDKAFASTAKADTYMIGIFGRQRSGGFDLAVQGVFGWSNWDVVRALPLFSRTADSSFNSKEFRLTARVGYDVLLNGMTVTPFGRVDLRHYDFEAFSERNAGGIGLAVASREKTVFNPEAGVRISGDTGGFRPFAEASYVFQGNVGNDRQVSFLGDRANSFRIEGVDPDGYARIGAGLMADLYGANFSLRGSYLTGGGNRAGEVSGAVTFRF
ncbi:autotransporter outer membrane beta-barrel domain-containing protein [Microvirga sp. SRT01]|uniref:Autotransporter outer membrane beta-barrel domain-containing protein n=1 Tax=Sphingomonas longa TaxID=2778730 RepID=A0ABS2D4W6_9SPHN|nr:MULTISPECIES: autotransporter outer membrane beta-barrel domain-containing protein [Alphaproteobacteria]MBM6575965.1 autotransporter outer membrane beta-barrel domain-containing protein [Sphingomonas sp. BT552]MBR7709011.1 autotransporter outer membrane beta-barrel domain-containing protein [Microvirga sp. SRT01]